MEFWAEANYCANYFEHNLCLLYLLQNNGNLLRKINSIILTLLGRINSGNLLLILTIHFLEI